MLVINELLFFLLKTYFILLYFDALVSMWWLKSLFRNSLLSIRWNRRGFCNCAPVYALEHDTPVLIGTPTTSFETCLVAELNRITSYHSGEICLQKDVCEYKSSKPTVGIFFSKASTNVNASLVTQNSIDERHRTTCHNFSHVQKLCKASCLRSLLFLGPVETPHLWFPSQENLQRNNFLADACKSNITIYYIYFLLFFCVYQSVTLFYVL